MGLYVIVLVILFVALFYYAFSKSGPQPKKKHVPGRTELAHHKMLDMRDEHGYNSDCSFEVAGAHIDSLQLFYRKSAHKYLPVRIVAEPDNPIDKNALAVFHNDIRIGYVPKNRQRVVLPLLGIPESYAYLSRVEYRYDEKREREFLNVDVTIEYKFLSNQ